MWSLKRPDISFHVLSFNDPSLACKDCCQLQKSSKRVQEMSPNISTPHCSCCRASLLVSCQSSEHSVLLIKFLIHCLFCLPSFHLHVTRVGETLGMFQDPCAGIEGIWRTLHSMAVELLLEVAQSSISLSSSSAC